MIGALSHSMFHDVLFPPSEALATGNELETLTLRRLKRFIPSLDADLRSTPIIVFDLETTGLDPTQDRIIEVGAHKLVGGELTETFEALVHTDLEITAEIIKLTGISPEMLIGQPSETEVLPRFLAFIEGSLLVAHNAEFDIGMIRAACTRLGIDLEWPCFCTLKMAKELLPDLENRRLDTLAAHYGLSFEARHRAIGDIKVTASVLKSLLTQEGQSLKLWRDLTPYTVN